MNCNRCKGAGWIPGHWMPEQCPECKNGEFTPQVDGDAAGCCIAAIGMALVLVCLILAPVARALWAWLA